MRITHRLLAAAIAAFTLAPAQAQVRAFPANLQYPNGACSLSPKELSHWFASGRITKGGLVTFANSIGFPQQNTTCDFYKWAHQMFLWISSPAAGGIVLESPTFFDINFDNSGGHYIPNAAGVVRHSFAVRGTKPQSIQPGGQAGGGDTVLSMNGSLVYFGVHANDVYAWFNTAVSNKAIPTTAPFPNTQSGLASVVSYASSQGASLPDANALGLELKTAWVDAATVPNAADYVTIDATVPNYVKTSSTLWTINKQSPTVAKTLALVGIHIVGAVQGHPEMVWATFEHRNNAPDNSFYFNTLFGSTVQVPYNSTGTWSFMTSGGSQSGALVPQMTIDPATGNVVATNGNSIRQNNVYRVNPWGNAPTAASAVNNSQLISLNLDIDVMLGLVGDVRGNYTQIGAVWTSDGSIPSGPTSPALRGSLLLANTTMETYHQVVIPNKSASMGCFGCHSSTTSTGTSHLFPINPLPTK
ncbi:MULTISPECIES: hypothetical protein [unclassified Rhizobacter]|uniref:hypothetical protein n=1 Tax=unclassified Rhizobacter TaxID=2640088 RepID=UPI0006F38792|nr:MULTISPECIES: hypothetical protein [unclassified Rhizobacter]KQU80990.1 hypothetical protein ASC88_15790 [Rhizobacter sp. Root29]KQW04534.1 hypothetical protein ASC98_05480 [Rhizobacter sp. Root1238]KRB06376.1 hypothetical protein ASE08_12035 [Rhizobacter sp. Root16D2]